MLVKQDKHKIVEKIVVNNDPLIENMYELNDVDEVMMLKINIEQNLHALQSQYKLE
jgi:hypothetical protein